MIISDNNAAGQVLKSLFVALNFLLLRVVVNCKIYLTTNSFKNLQDFIILTSKELRG